MGGDTGDVATGIDSSKNAIENNYFGILRVGWQIIKPSKLADGMRPVTLTPEYKAALIDLYNQSKSESNSNSDSQTSAGTQTGSSTANGGASLPPDDDDDKEKSKTDNNSQSLSDNQQSRKDVEDSWDKGTFDSPEGSLDYHFNKHGKEVGAENIEQYLRKATEFAKNLRGARTVKINNPTPGVIRYYKNGKYLDKLGDKIISFGKP